jgi:hypothetical protein
MAIDKVQRVTGQVLFSPQTFADSTRIAADTPSGEYCQTVDSWTVDADLPQVATRNADILDYPS